MVKEKTMYDIIKKQNGERFAKAIRNYDNGIFDVPNIDKIVKYAGRDAEPIMAYLVSLKGIKVQEHAVHMDPIKLLDMAGYDAYVADTLEKQNAISGYFAENEELCTFWDESRFKYYYIINAVRKDVDKIRRENFHNPMREDEYGTSVISIQILKSGGFISIKNRYNHTVTNPDNTFNSNPDNIIPGLADAIKHYFNVDFSALKVRLPDGYVVINNQIIKYNAEINNVYVGDGFYVKDGKVVELNTQYEYMVDWGIVLNTQSKTVEDITGRHRNVDFIQNEITGKKLQIIKAEHNEYFLLANDKKIIGFKDGQMTYFRPRSCNVDIHVSKDSKMHGVLDFSDVMVLELGGADLSDVQLIKFNNKNAESIVLRDVIGLHGDMDFSGVKNLSFEVGDASGVTSFKFNPNAKFLKLGLYGYKGNDIVCDFSNVNVLVLDCSDFTGQKLKFNPNAESINLIRFNGLNGDFDFSGVNSLALVDADLSNVTSIMFNPNAEFINLWGVVGLRGDLDFSNVKDLRILGANFSNVTSVKFNSDGYIDADITYILQQIEKKRQIKNFEKASERVNEKGRASKKKKISIQQQGNDYDKD